MAFTLSDIEFNLILPMVVLVMISAFFSMSETVFSSVNVIRLKTNIEDGIKGSKKAYWITGNFDLTITTILVGNNLANIALATISVSFWSSIFNGQPTVVNVINTVDITKIFCT